MNPGKYNTTIYQGATFNRTFTLSDTTLDLEDYDSVRMKIRRTPGSAVVWDSTADEPGGSIEITSSTAIELVIDATTTAGFANEEMGYDIELVKNDVVDRFLKGKILLDKEYTR